MASRIRPLVGVMSAVSFDSAEYTVLLNAFLLRRWLFLHS